MCVYRARRVLGCEGLISSYGVDSGLGSRYDSVVPFAGCLEQITGPARSVLEAGPSVRTLLGPRAREQLEFNLLEKLAFIAARCLAEVWEPERRRGVSYAEFVNRRWGPGPDRLARSHPVAGRLVAEATRRWTSAALEMVERLDSDRERLRAHLGWGPLPIGSAGEHLVDTLSKPLGDTHNGGRHVLRLTDCDGRRVMYKPRPMAQESAYSQLLEWANSRGFSHPLVVPRVLDRGRYGWMEYFEPDTGVGAEGVRRFWYRAGAHLCLLRLVGATDLHLENLLAVGDQPVFVDLECIMQPLPHRSLLPYGGEVGTMLVDSVLFTGLLPGALPEKGGLTVDLSGYGGSPSQVTGTMVPRWTGLGTDDLRLSEAMAETPPSANRPTGEAGPDMGMLIAGYEEMDDLLRGGDPPLVEFRELSGRVVFRATHLYARTVRSAVQPEALADEEEFASRLDELDSWVEQLAEISGQDEDRDWAVAILQREKEAVAALEIPWFVADAQTGTVRTARDQVGPGGFRATGWEGLNRRWLRRGDRDTAFQTDLVRITLEGGKAESGKRPSRPERSTRRSERAPLSRAHWIGEWLRSRAVDDSEGGKWWLESRTKGRTAVRVPSLADRSLYAGSSGVAIFLAGLARSTAEISEWGGLARAALVGALSGPGGGELSEWELTGGATGRAYAASVVGELLGDDELSQRAVRLMAGFEVPELSPVDPLDVVGGWSGVLLGLCAVHRRSQEPVLRESILGLAGAIVRELDRRTPPRWPQGHRRVGFAHGAGGVVWALARAGEVVGEEHTAEAVSDLLAGVNAKVSRRGGLPARTPREGAPAERGWCWGTAGFSLVRTRLRNREGALAGTHLDEALGHTAAAPERNHRLCCGVPGQVDALVEAGARPADVVALLDQLMVDIEDLVLEPGLTFRGASLFRGLAGVGYALLRGGAGGRDLPSVLLLD